MPACQFPFHLMAKPVGNRCNLACNYCFYLEKGALYDKAPSRMSYPLLEQYIIACFQAQPPDIAVTFTWQGGEPTLAGLDFYREAVRLQQKHGALRRSENSFQTNGLMIDDSWAAFFAENDFLVGLSLDGPADIHDAYRRDRNGGSSHTGVLNALRLLQRHNVRVNTLSCVSAASHGRGRDVYQFLKNEGVHYIQFTPVVERSADAESRNMGLQFGMPGGTGAVTEWSVGGQEYGIFLTDIFAEWVKKDVGTVFVMNFEWALSNFLGKPGAACHHQPLCGRCPVLEHDGSVFACDHYVYPDRKLGVLGSDSLQSMLDSQNQWDFGEAKGKTLSTRCRECAYLNGCWGGCPKHRFQVEESEQQNYLCSGYRRFFSSISPFMKAFDYLGKNDRPLTDIMDVTIMAKH